MTPDLIDQLERELRAASRRPVRLALARVPRAPAGAAVLILTLALCAAVAVPLLQARTRAGASHSPSATHPHATPTVTVGCRDTVSGQLAPGWHTHRRSNGTIIAGPITWLYLALEPGQDPAAIYRSHFAQGLAVVNPGRPVTVTVLPSERGRLSLDYTSVTPRKRFYLNQGVRSVTFKACPGPVGQTQFNGGFIVTRPQCARVGVQVAGEPQGVVQIPLGRSCSARRLLSIRRVLAATGVGQARFGQSPATAAAKLKALLGHPPTKPYRATSACAIDHVIQWQGLSVFFHQRHFVGYLYSGLQGRGGEPLLATSEGLKVGATLKTGQQLYGSRFHSSVYNGGVWWVTGPQGRLEGFTSNLTNPNGKIVTIEAGDVGCPSMTP